MKQAVATMPTFGVDLIHFDFLDSVNVEAPDESGALMPAMIRFCTNAPYEYEGGVLRAEDIDVSMLKVTRLTEGD